ncbi:mitochondrial outer membrane protein, partial [Diplocarpon rosae]
NESQHTMADPEDDLISQLFESLRRQVDPKKEAEQAKAVAAREAAQNAKARERLMELIGSNSSLPVTVSSICVIGAAHTRRSFLDGIFNPILSANKDAPYTLSEALQEVGTAADRLRRFEIFQPSLFTFIDRPSSSSPASTPTDIDIYIRATERSRLSLKTGTDLGNVEGSAYGNLTWRNILGGAESLTLNASTGTRTRSSYQASLDVPLLSDPDRRLTVDALSSSTLKPWASHDEALKGAGVKYTWGAESKHQLAYTGVWRQVTALAKGASPTVRADAGDSVKSSISHTWLMDKRNHPFLPNAGYLLKSVSEIAGWGPLRGDVAFWKSELETSAAIAIPVPGIKGDSGVSLTTGFRAGLLYPLSSGFRGTPLASRVNDRFQLGGPTDVRGFKISGLGPRDGDDAVGGDVYAAASANLLLPFPKVGRDSPLRWQLFANGGRLLALTDGGSDGGGSRGRGGVSTQEQLYKTLAQLTHGLPSLAAGVGVVYAHPVARFELNFSLPLVLRQGEAGRKGLQFGVGINFL